MRKKMGHSLPEDKSTHISIYIEDYKDIRRYAEYNKLKITQAVHSILRHLKSIESDWYIE